MPFLMSTHRSGGTLGGTPEAFAFTGMDIKKAPHTQGKVALVTPHLGGNLNRKGQGTKAPANARAEGPEGLREARGRELARSDGDSEALRGHDGQMGHGSDLRGLALGLALAFSEKRPQGLPDGVARVLCLARCQLVDRGLRTAAPLGNVRLAKAGLLD